MFPDRKLLLLVVVVLLTAVFALGGAPGSTVGAVGPASLNVTLHQILEAWRYALLHRSLPSAEGGLMSFGNSGYTDYGEWYTDVNYSPTAWRPGTVVTVNARLVVSDLHLEGLAARKIIADGLCLLVTAERTFDADGRFRQTNDERMSTLITPTGLPIEGGVQGAATTRFGYYGFRTPVDELQIVPLAGARSLAGQREVHFSLKFQLPPDLPPGIYRLRLDYGVITKEKRYYNLNCDGFARRSFPRGRVTESHIYSPLIRASGTHISGRVVDAAAIKPRLPWVLLNAYNSNGYRGVVAEEDKAHFGISGRNLIQDDVILPLYSNPADTRNRLTYNLEPQFPTDTIELRTNLPWNFENGELSIKVTNPDGSVQDLGTAPYIGKSGQWPTTRRSAFTAWRPPAYGQYTVRATGWLADIWGNRIEGGGTYKFWIANRMTLATATFQGQPYPVGNRYGRDLGFAPAVPADVEVHAWLFVNSDPNNVRKLSFSGKASPSGMFTAAQGNQVLPLDAPGEYLGYVLARFTDKDGHLWVCSMRHAGVVYPADSPIVARGKKLYIGGKYVDRGETGREGWVDTATGINYLEHINFPYNSGDVLLIASEHQGANKIENMLMWERKDSTTYDSRFQGVGASNVQLRTSNGYSPHLFPEYITEWNYFYTGAPRSGFMGRFMVAEDGARAPYWPTSPNSFGGQINASSNGDLPGDIYRLIGGLVMRKKGEPPAYAGYMASAFILPKGSKNNRIVAPGSEDLVGANGRKARFFLVGQRPGLMFETGTTFAPAAQIDPMVPAKMTATLVFPDGRQTTWEGNGDASGSWAGATRVTLDVPGTYRFFLSGEWQSHKGNMPGLPAEGGDIYVVEKDRPADAPRLRLNLPVQSTFTPPAPLTITGTSTATEVTYAAVIPGAVIAQGKLAVNGGRFQYVFDPTAISRETPIYDTAYIPTGRSEIRDVVHLTFASKETAPDGKTWHSFTRVILRGNQVLYVKD